jgi:linoleoyl-CoA desaturase
MDTPEVFGSELRRGLRRITSRPGRHAAARRNDAACIALCALLLGGSVTALLVGDHAPFAAAGLAVLLGWGIASSNMQLAHPAIHRSAGLSPAVRLVLPRCTGVSSAWWRAKHGLHHRHTNQLGSDDDLDTILFRFSPDVEWRPVHRLQPVLAPLCYPLLHLSLVLRGVAFAVTGRVRRTPVHQVSVGSAGRMLVGQLGIPVLLIVAGSVLHGVLPVMVVALTASLVAGALLSAVFVVEHTVIGTRFGPAAQGRGFERDTLEVCADVAAPPLVSWLVGGLNHHAAHHLAPRAAFVDLAHITAVVSAASSAGGVTRVEFPSWRSAWWAHLRFLAAMSRPAEAVGESPEPCAVEPSRPPAFELQQATSA